MGGSAAGNFGKTSGSTLDHISQVLSLLSFVPALDTLTNAISIPVDILRGDWSSASLDALGIIPIVGEIADTAKIVDKTSDAVKAFKKVSVANRKVKSISPSSLVATQRLNLSKKQYSNLKESIRKSGITESIKYVEYKGEKYVVDGHH